MARRNSLSGALRTLRNFSGGAPVCVNHGARGQACSLPALQLLYDNHVTTYEKICDKHGLIFIPLAFDTLGGMHPDSAKLLHNAFIKHFRFYQYLYQGAAPSRNALWRWVGRAFDASLSTAVLRTCRGSACATRRSVRTSRAMAACIQ